MKATGTLFAALALAATLAAGRSGSLIQQAPAAATAWKNPLGGDHEAERAGEKLYARECAACDGSNREGRGGAPPLDQPEVHQAAPGVLSWVLRNGSLRRGMPSFAHLPEAERWQIVAFLQRASKH